MRKTHLVGFSAALAGFIVLFAPAVSGESAALAAKKSVSSAADNFYAACGQGQHLVWFQEEMPLKVYIKPGSGTSPWTEKHSQLVRKAFEEIAGVSNGKLSFVFVKKKPYDISCVYKPLNAKTRAVREGAITHKSTGPHHIEDATITFHSDDEKFNVFERFYEVALHEVGHAVGLGHSTNPDDIMYHQLSHGGVKTKYSARDIKTLSMLYAYKPPANELRMVNRHKMKKLSNGNFESVKVNLSPDKYGAYSSKLTGFLAKKLASNISVGSASLACSYRFLVDGQGEIYNERLVSSSGNDQFDQQVRSVLSMASPLPKVDGLRMAEVAEIKLQFNPDGSVTDPSDSAPKLATVSGQTAMAAAPLKLAIPETKTTQTKSSGSSAQSSAPKLTSQNEKQVASNPFEDDNSSDAGKFKSVSDSTASGSTGDASNLSAINAILNNTQIAPKKSINKVPEKSSKPKQVSKSSGGAPNQMSGTSEAQKAVKTFKSASGTEKADSVTAEKNRASIASESKSDTSSSKVENARAKKKLDVDPFASNADTRTSEKGDSNIANSGEGLAKNDAASKKMETVKKFKSNAKAPRVASRNKKKSSSKYNAINAILNDSPIPKPDPPDVDVTPPVASAAKQPPPQATIPQPQYAAPKEYSARKERPAPKVFNPSGEQVSKVAMTPRRAESVLPAQPPERRSPVASIAQPRRGLTINQWKRIVVKQATVNKHRLTLSEGTSVEVSLGIKPDGYIQEMDIVTSSGNSLTDSLAKLQCRTQQPYPQPPGSKSRITKVTVTFQNN